MRLSNGSQTFRRDSEGLLGRGEGPNESEPFLFQQGENDHDHPAEELSVHRIQVLARRCAFPFARRIPRVTKRRTGQVLLILWLCWIVAACIEWRAQHNLRRSRKQVKYFSGRCSYGVVYIESAHSRLQGVPPDSYRIPTATCTCTWGENAT
ncbi:unnamed protein product [Ectocarpus sp. 4 AP-2014]